MILGIKFGFSKTAGLFGSGFDRVLRICFLGASFYSIFWELFLKNTGRPTLSKVGFFLCGDVDWFSEII